MKTILLPTDFSKGSLNAIEYAVEISKITNAELILLYVFNVPVVAAEVPFAFPTDEMEKDFIRELEKIKRGIHLKHGNQISIDCKCRYGLPADQINLFAKEENIDLIVMGMQGTSYLSEKVIGSTTTTLIRKSKCPILTIDINVKFKSIKKIVLACDYLETHNKKVLELLREFAIMFKSHIYILNVIHELNTLPTIPKALAGIKLEHSLEDIDHTFHFAENDDVVEGINKFVSDQHMDMVVMIPRMHSTLKNIFDEPQVKKTIFHAIVPILALHE